MDYLPDNVRKAFEQYVNGDRKEAFESLIPGSEYHLYLSIIDAFKIHKGKLTKKTMDMITRFKKNWPGFEADQIELQSYLLQFDSSKNDQEKKDILKKIDQNFVHGFYEYSKPAEIKGVKEKRARDRSRSPSVKTVFNMFIQENYFNLESTLKKASKSDYELASIQRSLLNKIDFIEISDKSFLTFLNLCPYISELTNKSFIAKLATFMNNNFKINKHYAVSCTHLDNLSIAQLEELGSKCKEI